MEMETEVGHEVCSALVCCFISGVLLAGLSRKRWRSELMKNERKEGKTPESVFFPCGVWVWSAGQDNAGDGG